MKIRISRRYGQNISTSFALQIAHMKFHTFYRSAIAGFVLLLTLAAAAQAQDRTTEKKKKHHTGSIYGSWGYNQEWYTNSTVHVQQDGLGNYYDLVKVQARDHLGWDKGIFNQPITIPQYNYRLGYYFNDKQDMGIELNFDHTKYLIKDGQTMEVRGLMNNKPVDE